MKKILLTAVALGLFSSSAFAFQHPVSIADQGSFATSGTVKTSPGTRNFSTPMNPAGQTLHGDHAYVFYQKPVNARKISMVFLHGFGQSGKSWETTPDGRDGFQNIFLERGYNIYLVDQPHRGRAGNSTTPVNLTATTLDQLWWANFRIGDFVTEELMKGSQFPEGDEAKDQFYRQMTPDTGSYDNNLTVNALSEVFDKVGNGILFTHSAGGDPGWITAMKNSNVKAVVAYEPGGGFAFPQGEEPEEMISSSPFGNLKPNVVDSAEFEKLTKIPIVIYFGDYIPEEYTDEWNLDNWRVRVHMARKFADVVNRHGGDATVVELPKIGIYGNGHFLMADKNNVQLANVLTEWLHRKNLDIR